MDVGSGRVAGAPLSSQSYSCETRLFPRSVPTPQILWLSSHFPWSCCVLFVSVPSPSEAVRRGLHTAGKSISKSNCAIRKHEF